jgi:hypothetical protein
VEIGGEEQRRREPLRGEGGQRLGCGRPQEGGMSLVLGIGTGRASPAQAYRASCQTGLGQKSPNNFWSVSCQPEV